jgi:hypothetical protein
MLKPSGLLCYSLTIAGGPDSVDVDVMADDDDSGNHYGAEKIGDASVVQTSMARWFSAEGVAASGDASKVFISGISVTTDSDGRITEFKITVGNNSAAAGDTVTGKLYVLLPQAGNFGL